MAKKFCQFTFGVAGGILPTTVKMVFSEIGKDVSIDIETGMLDNNDILDLEKANLYLANAEKALK